MTKYYCVRSQEQWDWLADKLNIYCVKSMACPVIIEHEQGQKNYQIVPHYGGFEPVIEVSQMMEDEKMENEDYVTIKGEDLLKIKNEDNSQSFCKYNDGWFFTPGLFGGIHIPKSLVQQPKIKMTQAEKDEFDKLKDEMSLDRHDLDYLLTAIIEDSEDFTFLYHRLYVVDGDKFESQLEFARAWADPSLIEVVKEPKFNVKVPVSKGRDYYEKYSTVKEDNLVIVGTLNSLRELSTNTEFQFTEAELKQYGLDSDMYEKVEVQE